MKCPECGRADTYRTVKNPPGIEECIACGHWKWIPPEPNITD